MAAANQAITLLNTQLTPFAIGNMKAALIRFAFGASGTYDTGGVLIDKAKLRNSPAAMSFIHAFIPLASRVVTGAGTNVQTTFDTANQKIQLWNTGATIVEVSNAADLSATNSSIDALILGT
jgi:hypothetical protein